MKKTITLKYQKRPVRLFLYTLVLITGLNITWFLFFFLYAWEMPGYTLAGGIELPLSFLTHVILMWPGFVIDSIYENFRLNGNDLVITLLYIILSAAVWTTIIEAALRIKSTLQKKKTT